MLLLLLCCGYSLFMGASAAVEARFHFQNTHDKDDITFSITFRFSFNFRPLHSRRTGNVCTLLSYLFLTLCVLRLPSRVLSPPGQLEVTGRFPWQQQP